MVAFAYAGYPLLIHLLARSRATEAPAQPLDDAALPPVTVVICARNEARRIAARIQNLYDGDYPDDKLNVLVVSDGSTDGTADVARNHGGERLAVIECTAKGGKAAAVNVGGGGCDHRRHRADGRTSIICAGCRAQTRQHACGRTPQAGAVSGELDPARRQRRGGLPAFTGA